MALPHDLCYSIADLRLLLKYLDSSVLQHFTFVISIVICLVGLVGNAVVICFLGLIMKKHKSKYWFLNLAIADFLSLLMLPFHAISTLQGTWTFGLHMCKLYIFSLCVSMYASIYILIALNIARVLSIAQPMFHLKFNSKHVSVWICTFIWFITILFSLPAFHFASEAKIGETIFCSFVDTSTIASVVNNGHNVSSENSTRDISVSDIHTKLGIHIQQCFNDTCCGGEETLNFWNHCILTTKQCLIPFHIIGYFIPLVAVIICNITIVVHVRKSKTVNPHRLYRIVVIIVILYFITWTPLVIAQIVSFIAILNMNLVAMFNVLIYIPLLTSISHVNNSLNPILYVLNGGQMRTRLSNFINSISNSNT